jgi:hypothetical protein
VAGGVTCGQRSSPAEAGGVRRVEVVLGCLRQHALLQQQFLPAHVLTAPSPVLSRTEDGGGGSRGSGQKKKVP